MKKPYGLTDREWNEIVLAESGGWWKYATGGAYSGFLLLALAGWLVVHPNPRVTPDLLDLIKFSVAALFLRFVFRVSDYFCWKRDLIWKCRKSGSFTKENEKSA